MATPTYELIEQQTLSSTATSVTFSSIPTTDSNGEPFRDMVLVINAAITQATTRTLLVRFNGSTSGYDMIYAYGDGSTTSGNYFSQSSLNFDNGSYVTNSFSSVMVYNIMNYTQTSTYKPVLFRGNNTNANVAMGAGSWNSTSTINSISIDPENTFQVASTFKLFGIVG